MACPAQQRERKRFKGSADELRLVDAIFENSRALAKVVSAVGCIVHRGDDIWPLHVAIEELCHQRWEMRAKLETLLRSRIK